VNKTAAVNKKVRYAAGFAGAVPALGMMAAAAAAAPVAAHTGSKTVRLHMGHASPGARPDATCKGNRGNHHTSNSITIRFYSKSVSPLATCIGTVQTSFFEKAILGGEIQTKNGDSFCRHSTKHPETVQQFDCGQTFTDIGLAVHGWGSPAAGGLFTVSSSFNSNRGGFRHNGWKA
jgi:hypothetical protein